MLTFNSELFCRLLIGLLLGFLFHYKTCKNQFSIINQKIDQIIIIIEPIKRHKTNKPTSDKKYPHKIENLWKDSKQLFDKRIELNSNFSFGEMAIEICELLREGILPQ